MNQTLNSFCEEDSNSIENFFNTNSKYSKSLSEFLPTEKPNEKEQNFNDIFHEKYFCKEFNKVFNKTEKTKSIDETKYHKKILFKSIPLNKMKYFPFHEGVGIKTCLEKLGYHIIFTKPNKISIIEPMNHKKRKIKRKFKILDFSEDEKGKLKKVKYKDRRFVPDDIRKKIKSKFHKNIKNIINLQLKSAGSAKLFAFFPQNFVTNVTVKLNKLALNYTFEELIKTNIASSIFKLKENRIDIEKYESNLKVLNYLDKNPIISKSSSFNIIRKMKYKALLKAYFESKEFENSIIELHKKKESVEYIEKYVNEALRYVHFFSSNIILPKNKKKKNNNIIQIIYDEEEEDEKDNIQ